MIRSWMYIKGFPKGKTSFQLGWYLHKLRSWGFYQQPQANEFHEDDNKRQKISIAEDGSELFACEPEPMRSMAAILVLFLSAGATFGQFFSCIGAVKAFLFSKQKLKQHRCQKNFKTANVQTNKKGANKKQKTNCEVSPPKDNICQTKVPPQNSCVKVYAEYQLREKSFWGYDVSVHNHAEEVAAPHKVHDSGKTLCAKARFRRRADRVVFCCRLLSLGCVKTVINSVFVFVKTYFFLHFINTIYSIYIYLYFCFVSF